MFTRVEKQRRMKALWKREKKYKLKTNGKEEKGLSAEFNLIPCCPQHRTGALGRQKHGKAHDPSPHPSHLGKQNGSTEPPLKVDDFNVGF